MTSSVARHDVAIVVADLQSGGAQRAVAGLTNGWATRSLKVCVITMASPETDFFVLPQNVTRSVIGGMGESTNPLNALFANARRIARLRKAIKTSGARVVLSFVGATNVLTVIASKGLDVRVVISEQNDPSKQSLGPTWDRLRRWVYPRADIVTANSSNALQALSQFVPSRKLRLGPNPLPSVKTADPSLRKPMFLTVARLVHQKGIDILLRAFARIVQEVPDWSLVIVGDGVLRKNLQQQASDLGIDPHITWATEPQDVDPLYEQAAVFLLPSRHEGTPNALQEAMAWGVPPIVSNAAGGALEYVQHDRSGLIVPVEDDRALADAMLELSKDPEKRGRLGGQAQDRIRQEPVEVTLDTWERFF